MLVGKQVISVSGYTGITIDVGVVECKTGQGECTIDLPNIFGSNADDLGYKLAIQDVDNNASVNNIILRATKGQKINGQDTFVISTDGGGLYLVPVGNSYWIATATAASLGGGLEIPKLIMSIGDFNKETKYSDLFASYLPTSSETWKEYNPRIFLFQYRQKRLKKSVKNNPRPKNAGYYHPVHNNGADYPNSKFFGGTQTDKKGVILPAKKTEFAIDSSVIPYEKMAIEFDALAYTKSGTDELGGLKAIKAKEFPFSSSLLSIKGGSTKRFRGMTYGKGTKSVGAIRFKFAIGIDNPNVEARDNSPVIFGEMSEQIIYTWYVYGGASASFANIIGLIGRIGGANALTNGRNSMMKLRHIKPIVRDGRTVLRNCT